jgi:serine/threonine protein kinase
MQYVASGLWQEKLDRNGLLEVAKLLQIGLQTAKGLAAEHARQLIHRDVKHSARLCTLVFSERY